MYSRILVPLDGSSLAEHALPYARVIGKELRLPVQLLACLTGVADAGAERVNIYRVAQDYLDRAAAPLRADGVHVTGTVTEGDAASRIADDADGTANTLVVMSTHGRSGVSRFAVGSITDRVLRATTSPMLIVRPEADGAAPPKVSVSNLIVPLDGSELAERALPHAMDLAKALAASVTVTRATSSMAADYLPVSPDDVAEATDPAATKYLHEISGRLRTQGQVSVDQRLLLGHPASAIIDLVEEVPDSMVVMTSHGRSGVWRWALGSVTEQVVRHCRRPVLVLRSAGQRT